MGRIKTPEEKVNFSDFFDEETLAFYQRNPSAFIYEIMFHENSVYDGGDLYLSDQQEAILQAVADAVDGGETKISIVAGKGLGKTAIEALLMCWFVSVFHLPKVVATAPSFPQLKSALWTEVSKWMKQSLVSPLFEITSERMYLKDDAYKSNWWAEPRTSTRKENMQGLHEDNMLFLIDEASGVPDEIIDALDTTRTGDPSKGVNILLLMGNGTKTDGLFYDSHNQDAKHYKTLQFSSIDSPFVDKKKTAELIERYGWEHDVIRVSVRGLFPKGNSDSLISLSDVEACMMRDVDRGVPIQIGVDVARYGADLTVLTWREGWYVHPQVTASKTGVNDVVDMTLALVKTIRNKTDYQGIIDVKVDDTGVGGGCTDYLNLDRENNINVVPCNFGGAADQKDLYHDSASEMWGFVRDNIDKIQLPESRFLAAELSTRRFKLPGGRIMIESKSVYKKEFKASPDLADSLVLCFAQKKPERTTLKDFDKLDSNTVKNNVSIDAYSETFVSTWYSRDMYASLVHATWDGFRLTVHTDYAGDDNIFSVGSLINHVRSVSTSSICIGNDRMFGDLGSDLVTQYRKLGVRVQKNRRYDELGGTQLLNQMISDKRVIIDSKCGALINQLEKWNVRESRAVIEVNYGLCYAMVNLMSFLREKIERPAPKIKQPGSGYKNQKSLINPVRYNPSEEW